MTSPPAAPTNEEKGFLPSTVADIVHRAGVSHGTFYNYFPAREDILRAVATEARIMRGWQAEMADSIRGLVDRSFEEAVDHIVKIVIRVLGLREPSH